MQNYTKITTAYLIAGADQPRSGVARILHYGPQKLSAASARIEAPKVPRGVGLGRGCPPSQPTMGSK